ncbi:tRNA pseudouridine(55) synthase TruB [Schaalia vaccimaxillae]|uniref:tRNA pseudouridine(55) synthase TruB n=1 Tax=Schaalia vaccimaxillae TaxID=183916 RepID=UPI0003B69F51|nr:tRNA pseudouridine(55) synthase TruB [Schaalia vaccimaxillae]
MAARVDNPVPGLVVIDKPQGITSHDVVSKVRRLAATRKVGHAGTLDPMATGLLVLGIGKATKLLTWVTGDSKSYQATIRLGATTTTDDAEGEYAHMAGCLQLGERELETAIAKLRGTIQQVPSTVSAIKVNGKRAYALARAGQEVHLKARTVTIDRFEVVGPILHTTAQLSDDADAEAIPVVDVQVEVDCSSGTYIRALARDLGQDLGCGAHLTALRRTRVGQFCIEDALTLEELEERSAPILERGHQPDPSEAGHSRVPIIDLADAVTAMFPILELDADEAGRFVHGQAPRRSRAHIEALQQPNDKGNVATRYAAVGPNSQVLGLVEIDNGRLKTTLVFQGDH